MSWEDIHSECGQQKWAPILVARIEGKTIIPVFSSAKICNRFIQRNFANKRDWVYGVVNVTAADLKWIEEKGFFCHLIEYPKKLTDVAEFDIEVREYDAEQGVEVLPTNRSCFA